MTFVYSRRRVAKLGVLTFGVSVVTIMAAGNAQAVDAVEPPAQIFGYSILSEVMRDEFTTLRDRLGNERFNAFTSGDASVAEAPVSVWTRLDYVHRNIEATGRDETNPISEHEWEQNRGELAVGVDMPMPMGSGTLLLGASGHAVYGSATVHAFSPGEADVDSIGFGLGLEAAFFAGNGFYVDLQGRVTFWDTDVDFKPNKISKSVDGLSGGLSLEAGKRFGFDSGLAVSPRIQVAYTDIDFDRVTDKDGVSARQQNSDSLLLGAGVLTEYAIPDWGMSIYSDLSASWDTLADSSVRTSTGLVIKTGRPDAWGNVAIGTSFHIGKRVSAYLEVEYGSALDEHFGETTGKGGQAGIRIEF
jgi:fibronectin-binding autotransporter adhesin